MTIFGDTSTYVSGRKIYNLFKMQVVTNDNKTKSIELASMELEKPGTDETFMHKNMRLNKSIMITLSYELGGWWDADNNRDGRWSGYERWNYIGEVKNVFAMVMCGNIEYFVII